MTREQLMQALRNAHAAGDQAGAQRIAQMIQAQPATEAEPSARPAPATQDPMLPSPDTDTRSTQQYLQDTGLAPQPVITREEAAASLQPQPMPAGGGPVMDLARSGASGLVRGATELAALPSTIGSGLDALYERTGLIPEGSRGPMSSPVGQGIRAASDMLTSNASQYEPQTTLGEYTQTVGEFVGGGAGGRAGVAGGLASEAAGQATEGTSYEPMARIVAGLVGGTLGSTARPNRVNPRLMGEASDDADALIAQGVRPTAGQISDNAALMRIEGSAGPTGQQLDDFTSAALRTTGSASTRATPTALREVSDEITDGMNAILENVDVPISQNIGAQVARISDEYGAATAGKVPQVNVRRVADEILDAATSPNAQTIPASQLRQWRSRLGRLTTSSDEAVRDMAHELRGIIDDVTEQQLTSMGRADDVAALADLRNKYRNLLVLTDASTRGGREGARGVLTPERLSTASQRTVGRTNYALGRGTDLSDLSLQGLRVLGSSPTVQADASRNISGLIPLLAGSGLGAGAAAQTGNLGLATAGTVAGLMAPTAARVGVRSPVVQSLLTNPATVLGQAARSVPGALAQRPQ